VIFLIKVIHPSEHTGKNNAKNYETYKTKKSIVRGGFVLMSLLHRRQKGLLNIPVLPSYNI
jgi:hypothetical protein